MTENEKRLREVLRRLLERLDYATISFEELGGEKAIEAALEFDETYVEACEMLGMDLAESPKPQSNAPGLLQNGL